METICLLIPSPVESEQASLRCFVVAAFLEVMLVVSLLWVGQRCLGIVTDLKIGKYPQLWLDSCFI
jgi:hypothetical protein